MVNFKNISNLFVLILIVLLTSATTASLITVKPALPISVVVSQPMSEHDVYLYTHQYIKRGYIVKSIFRSGGESYGSCMVIMEKY